MNLRPIKKVAIAVAGSLALTSMAFASCPGVIDNFFNQAGLDPDCAGDQWNAEHGNPVDHLAAAGANVLVPGSGPVLEGVWAFNRMGGFGVFGRPMPAPMGDQCLTPWGISNPGPWEPIGSACNVNGIPGRVVR